MNSTTNKGVNDKGIQTKRRSRIIFINDYVTLSDKIKFSKQNKDILKLYTGKIFLTNTDSKIVKLYYKFCYKYHPISTTTFFKTFVPHYSKSLKATKLKLSNEANKKAINETNKEAINEANKKAINETNKEAINETNKKTTNEANKKATKDNDKCNDKSNDKGNDKCNDKANKKATKDKATNDNDNAEKEFRRLYNTGTNNFRNKTIKVSNIKSISERNSLLENIGMIEGIEADGRIQMNETDAYINSIQLIGKDVYEKLPCHIIGIVKDPNDVKSKKFSSIYNRLVIEKDTLKKIEDAIGYSERLHMYSTYKTKLDKLNQKALNERICKTN